MYGLPPTNPAPTVHPSCRAQLPNAANIPGLDMDFRKAGSENGDGTSSDGDFHSNHTTPMNYMRRSTTPTNQTRKAEMLQQNLVHHDHDEGNFHMENDLSALRYSLSADSVDSSFVNRFLSAPQQSDNASEATAEPFNQYREAQKGVPIRIGAPANDAELSMSALSLDPSTAGGIDKKSEKEDGLVAGLQGLSFQSKLNEGSRTYSIGESYELLGERADLGAASDFPSAFPAPRDRESYSGDTITPVAHHNSGAVPPQAPRSQRSTPNATPTHYAQMQAQQQGQYAPARPGLPMPPPQQQQGMVGRRAEPYQAQQRMPPQHGGYSDDPYAQVTGLAALAMDSLEGPNQNQGPNSQHLVSQRSPTHAQGYYGNQQHGQPQGQGQQPAQGYATASRYGEVVRTPAPYHAGYGQQPPQPQYQTHGQHGAQYGGYGAQQGMAVGMGPGAGMPGAPSNLIYQVQFKRGVRSFTLSPRANFAVKERDFVVVEADRGEDIGIVVEILDMMAFMERRMNTPRPPPQQQQDGEDQNVCCILRLATLHERQQLPDKFHTEKDIVQSCNELATYGFGLPIMVYDAELQFDRRKLTIYYDCSVRIDFRDFVRQLYATYKARIWMKKICPQIPPDVQPFAAMALATGVQFSQAAGAMPGGAGGHPSGHMGGY